MAKKSDFTHLHLHTEFSILDSPISTYEAFEKAGELGFSSLAITDHGNISGVIRFQKDAKETGIKPIFGAEFYLLNTDLEIDETLDKDARRYNYSHILLLAENDKGLKSLAKLATHGAVNGFYYRPRFDYEALSKNTEGLICLTACMSGPVGNAIQQGLEKEAFKRLWALKQIFGDNLFYEIHFNEMLLQRKINRIGISMSRQLGIPLVYTSDVHYLEPEDNEAQDVMVLMKRRKTMRDWKTDAFSTRHLFMKTLRDVVKDYMKWGGEVTDDDFTEAIANVGQISQRCNASYKVDDYQYPVFDTGGMDMDEFFLQRVQENFRKLEIPKSEMPEYIERLEKELKLLIKKGLSSYLLIIAELNDFARDNNIPIGPGRGSVGGSLVSYVLGITAMDPLRFNLSFERFLTEERAELPDIDLDYCDWGRKLAIDYLAEKYGDDLVFPIVSFSKMRAKGVLRDVGRVLEIPSDIVAEATKTIDDRLLPKGKVLPLLAENSTHKKFFDKYPDLYNISAKLEMKVRHLTRHAAGVVVIPEKARDLVPIVKSGNILHCGFDYDHVYLCINELKLLKIDVLGLATLSIIGEALDLIEKRGGEYDEGHFWKLNDPEVYKEIRLGHTIGTFQMEGSGFRRMLRGMAPSRFAHLITAIALYRPSTLAAKIDQQYIQNKRANFRYQNKILSGILDETYGCMVYQEQIMEIASQMGGLTPNDADLFRLALTKWHSAKTGGWKGLEVIDEFEERFIAGAQERGFEEDEAREFFEKMREFSRYGFNKAHSCAYAITAYHTMYLKVRHTIEFFTALFRHTPPTSEYKGVLKLSTYMEDAQRMGIGVLPPNIEKSGVNFEIEDDAIRAGLSLIKWVGVKPAQQVIEQRPFSDFDDFLEKCGNLNSRALRSMIAAGCFENMKFGRPKEVFEKLKAHKKFDYKEDDVSKLEVLCGIKF